MDEYRFFEVTTLARQQLSPSLLRIVVAGPQLAHLQWAGPDLYAKVFFPSAETGFADLRRGADWYSHYRAVDIGRRPPMRTFTLRRLAAANQLALDFAAHTHQGPASRWALQARRGDPLVLYAPLAARWGRGFTWQVPAGASRLLVLADECAVPAATAIVESLAEAGTGVALTAILEVPQVADQLALQVGGRSRLQWWPRQRGAETLAYGEGLRLGLASYLDRLSAGAAEAGEPHADANPWPDPSEPLWDLAAGAGTADYVWIAAETATAAALRRQVVQAGIAARAISCMGYWRRGRAFC